jgi:L-alanine-DL-glutamate epimerase-like enolase superfamily enzyme
MKITDIETIMLRLPEVSPVGDGLQDVLIIRVHTDEGITGVGEAHTCPPVLKAIIDAPVSQLTVQGLKQLLIGKNPLHINELWNLMYDCTVTFGRRGVVLHAISGIDIALWDIFGKFSGLPIHQLMGGAVRDQVPVYASDLTPETQSQIMTNAKARVGEGYRALKFGWGGLGQNVKDDARWVRELRRALGPEVDIMIDMGSPVPFDDAVWLGRALAEEDVFFLEEPLSPDDLDGFASLVDASPTPIATGEKETTRFGFRDLMERGKLRIIQPDIARVGGLTEMRRIAALAEVRNVRVIPHCWATDILVAATMHFLATQKEAPYQEFNVMANPLRTELLQEPMRPKDGLLSVPQGPGLGLELNQETLETYHWNPKI